MANVNKNNSEQKITSALLWGGFFIFLAVLLPILLVKFPEAKPETESIATWFQRSGSIMVILAIWLELKMHSISGYMNVDESVVVINEFPTDAVKRYNLCYKIAMIVGFFIAVIGSIIWGYGDLLYLFFDCERVINGVISP
tara:strand:- start:3681 stop:4103 length:423 start_codon:yes stop_codon:yes gene_type:complete